MGNFYFGYYFKLAEFPEIITNTNYLFINVTDPPPQSAPFFTIGPSTSYTLTPGSSLDLVFEITDRENDAFTIQVDLGTN